MPLSRKLLARIEPGDNEDECIAAVHAPMLFSPIRSRSNHRRIVRDAF